LSADLALSSAQQVWAQTNPPPNARPARPVETVPEPGTFRVETSPATGAGQGIVVAPVPVQNLVVFETAMISKINQVLRDPGLAQRRNVIFTSKLWIAWFESKFVVYETNAVAVQQLTRAQLQDLRDSIVRNVDAAVQLELAGKPAMRSLGSAVLRDNMVTGKMTPLSRDLMTAVQGNRVQ
jgi:hypothetical protein